MSCNPYYISHDKKCVLIWNTKCACTSLHGSFVKDICEIVENKDPRVSANENKIIYSSYNKIPEDYTIYWGIRNPFDRIVSCFFNKFIVYLNKRITKNNIETFSLKLLNDLNIELDELTFQDFLLGIKKLKKENKYIDHHFTCQVDTKNYNLIKNNKNMNIFDISKIPKIFKSIKKENSSFVPKVPILKDCSKMKVKDISLEQLSKENFINSLNLVKDVFKIDYELFSQYGYNY